MVVPDPNLVIQRDLVQKTEDVALVKRHDMAGDHGVAASTNQRRKVAVVDGHERQCLPCRLACGINHDAAWLDLGIQLDGRDGTAYALRDLRIGSVVAV